MWFIGVNTAALFSNQQQHNMEEITFVTGNKKKLEEVSHRSWQFLYYVVVLYICYMIRYLKRMFDISYISQGDCDSGDIHPFHSEIREIRSARVAGGAWGGGEREVQSSSR